MSLAIVPCVLLLLPAVVLTALVSTFASAVRAVGRRFEPAFVPWTDLIEFDRRLGWKPKANLDSHYLAIADDVFRLVTDREGWPGAGSLDEAKVVVIGDSFAFGYGIDTNRSFAALTPGLPVKAIGAPGYSMVQGVRLMEQFGERLRGKLVLWFTFLENDLQDNLAPEMRGYRAPFVRPDRVRGTWEIVDEHVAPKRWECSDLDSRRLFPTLCVPGPVADRAYEASDFLIQQGGLVCDRVGARLAIVTIPHPMQMTSAGRAELAKMSSAPASCDPDLPDRRVAESCRRHGVPVVLGIKHFSRSDYKRRESIHWNQAGHLRMATLVKQLYDWFASGRLDDELRHESRNQEHPPIEKPATATISGRPRAADSVSVGQ